jgi:hypothetical protein
MHFLTFPPSGTKTPLAADAALILACSCDGAFDALVLSSCKGAGGALAGVALFMKKKEKT